MSSFNSSNESIKTFVDETIRKVRRENKWVVSKVIAQRRMHQI